MILFPHPLSAYCHPRTLRLLATTHGSPVCSLPPLHPGYSLKVSASRRTFSLLSAHCTDCLLAATQASSVCLLPPLHPGYSLKVSASRRTYSLLSAHRTDCLLAATP